MPDMVCENHPDKAWPGDCCGGAGMPAPTKADQLQKLWHTVECEFGQAYAAKTPHDFGYFHRRAGIAFEEMQRLMRQPK